ncbi:type 2 lanthipeptide synthetase LanM family protein [Stenotrophomonas sp. 24(2023)]|uniref:type 2 lanthipeptide synthetase LanM family protein n=1 Tax=Stenotrophomonas sp. 24(2023) TaxID=3068324 RepID=UPI0027DFBE6E|nr:type 2 lanthipeptide synthetase LanM family protein [Stenotrophomonas sp. 24(2023)]WMJ69302.1 type 2 lanthipeptide synthetase LanM family protein [Stenotrophomonas sp. 24(2023)]
MTAHSATASLARIVTHFLADTCIALRAGLQALQGPLHPDEIERIDGEARQALLANAQLKLNRVLLLELHAAVRCGQIDAAADAATQHAQFEALATHADFQVHLRARYPVLQARLERMLDGQCEAIIELAARIGSDRPRLAALLGRPAGHLQQLALGRGDLHAGGRTVARVHFDGGTVMYKPRSLRIDHVLDALLAGVFGDDPDRVRVPAVIDRGSHGWAAFAPHRYCEGEPELHRYYQGLGHWLAILRLIGGTDIHLENLIACGPVPVVVDAESVFAPVIPTTPSGYGNAHDTAVGLMRNSVLRTGIVPFRSSGLGMDGVDLSAAGALPGEQPRIRIPAIVESAEGPARLGMVEAEVAVAQNHPSPQPDVSRYWDDISAGFMAASERLRARDADGTLAPLLACFEGCQVREVLRPTMIYAEMARMLWHPASLHKEAAAVERAMDLLQRNAAVAPAAPASAAAVRAEIDDLRHGDIPIFVCTLDAPRIASVVDNWRSMRIDLEDVSIRSTLVATDLNQHALARAEARSGYSYAARHPHADALDARRRMQAATAARNLIRLSVRGNDGTLTWITPEVTRTGWTVQPVQPDLYFGLGGIAFALAGYATEVRHGRADPVAGLDSALAGAITVLGTMARLHVPGTDGGFVGIGSQVWAFVALHDLLQRPDLLAQARQCAARLEQHGFAHATKFELIDGVAGLIPPLIALAEATGEARWLALAARAADRMQAAALIDGDGVRWPTPQFSTPIGGFGHGAMGMGWALARLALTGAGTAAQRQQWQALADGAFAFQAALFEDHTGRWRDLHLTADQKVFPTWCHGSVGIGLAAADLYARTGAPTHLRDLRRAVADASGQWGFSHTLCHGDLSTRELLLKAAVVDPQGCPYPQDTAAIEVISSVEEHQGMVGGLTRAAFTPGLMIGLSGAIYGFLRMHPRCRLPSPLLLERTATTAPHAVGARHGADMASA